MICNFMIVTLLSIFSLYIQASQVSTAQPEKATIEKKASKLDLQMIDAAEKNELDKIQKLLLEGANIDARNSTGDTALFKAAFYGHTPIVMELINAQANVHIPDNYGFTPLMAAARGSLASVEALINSGVKINAQTTKGRTALMVAAGHGHKNIIIRLLNAGANPYIRTIEGKTFKSILKAKHPELIKDIDIQKALDAYAKAHPSEKKQQDLSNKVECPAPKALGRLIGEYFYTGHALDQMQQRGIKLEDVNFVLDYGKFYPDKERFGTVKVVHKNKNIGVVFNKTEKTIITVIAFEDQQNIKWWLLQDTKNSDPLVWLKNNRETLSANKEASCQPSHDYNQARWAERQRQARLQEELESQGYSDEEYEEKASAFIKNLD